MFTWSGAEPIAAGHLLPNARLSVINGGIDLHILSIDDTLLNATVFDTLPSGTEQQVFSLTGPSRIRERGSLLYLTYEAYRVFTPAELASLFDGPIRLRAQFSDGSPVLMEANPQVVPEPGLTCTLTAAACVCLLRRKRMSEQDEARESR